MTRACPGFDDPTNENMAHERVRVRKALDVLDGLGVSRVAVALSAARLGRARSALEVARAGLMQVAVRIEANIFAAFDLECWVHGPAEWFVRRKREIVVGREAARVHDGY
jgi:tRNA(Ile)-lysidine synthase